MENDPDFLYTVYRTDNPQIGSWILLTDSADKETGYYDSTADEDKVYFYKVCCSTIPSVCHYDGGYYGDVDFTGDINEFLNIYNAGAGPVSNFINSNPDLIPILGNTYSYSGDTSGTLVISVSDEAEPVGVSYYYSVEANFSQYNDPTTDGQTVTGGMTTYFSAVNCSEGDGYNKGIICMNSGGCIDFNETFYYGLAEFDTLSHCYYTASGNWNDTKIVLYDTYNSN